ncbi:hypothetical protein [Rhodococcus sp. 1163]|uniref:hypothetical protein n=1 Tax=Rhodococcus sp. 1163 TaxID=1905289 RepID=UPI00117AB515|nr:hypothetical protein [Rhodococcus sp. 1163]
MLSPDALECLINLVRELGAVMSNHNSGPGHDTISSDDAQSSGRGLIEDQCRLIFFDEGNAKFRGFPPLWFSCPINGPHLFDFIARNIYDVGTRNHDSQGVGPSIGKRGVLLPLIDDPTGLVRQIHQAKIRAMELLEQHLAAPIARFMKTYLRKAFV